MRTRAGIYSEHAGAEKAKPLSFHPDQRNLKTSSGVFLIEKPAIMKL